MDEKSTLMNEYIDFPKFVHATGGGSGEYHRISVLSGPAYGEESMKSKALKGFVFFQKALTSSHEHSKHQNKDDSGIAFGRISFSPSSFEKPKLYLRVPHNSNPKMVLHFIENVWNLPRPKLVIGVTGGAEDFQVSSELEQMVDDLMIVARKCGAWIITGGTKGGVMKLFGQARSRISGSVPLLGIVPWGVLMNRDALVVPCNSINYGPCIRQPVDYVDDTDPVKGCALLERHHSHFILVDDGSTGCFGTERRLRGELEFAARSVPSSAPSAYQGQDRLGWDAGRHPCPTASPVATETQDSREDFSAATAVDDDGGEADGEEGSSPHLERQYSERLGGFFPKPHELRRHDAADKRLAVCLCIEGGLGSVDTAYESALNGTPVLAVRGTGRAADLLAACAEAYRAADPARGGGNVGGVEVLPDDDADGVAGRRRELVDVFLRAMRPDRRRSSASHSTVTPLQIEIGPFPPVAESEKIGGGCTRPVSEEARKAFAELLGAFGLSLPARRAACSGDVGESKEEEQPEVRAARQLDWVAASGLCVVYPLGAVRVDADGRRVAVGVEEFVSRSIFAGVQHDLAATGLWIQDPDSTSADAVTPPPPRPTSWLATSNRGRLGTVGEDGEAVAAAGGWRTKALMEALRQLTEWGEANLVRHVLIEAAGKNLMSRKLLGHTLQLALEHGHADIARCALDLGAKLCAYEPLRAAKPPASTPPAPAPAPLANTAPSTMGGVPGPWGQLLASVCVNAEYGQLLLPLVHTALDALDHPDRTAKDKRALRRPGPKSVGTTGFCVRFIGDDRRVLEVLNSLYSELMQDSTFNDTQAGYGHGSSADSHCGNSTHGGGSSGRFYFTHDAFGEWAGTEANLFLFMVVADRSDLATLFFHRAARRGAAQGLDLAMLASALCQRLAARPEAERLSHRLRSGLETQAAHYAKLATAVLRAAQERGERLALRALELPVRARPGWSLLDLAVRGDCRAVVAGCPELFIAAVQLRFYGQGNLMHAIHRTIEWLAGPAPALTVTQPDAAMERVGVGLLGRSRSMPKSKMPSNLGDGHFSPILRHLPVDSVPVGLHEVADDDGVAAVSRRQLAAGCFLVDSVRLATYILLPSWMSSGGLCLLWSPLAAALVHLLLRDWWATLLTLLEELLPIVHLLPSATLALHIRLQRAATDTSAAGSAEHHFPADHFVLEVASHVLLAYLQTCAVFSPPGSWLNMPLEVLVLGLMLIDEASDVLSASGRPSNSGASIAATDATVISAPRNPVSASGVGGGGENLYSNAALGNAEFSASTGHTVPSAVGSDSIVVGGPQNLCQALWVGFWVYCADIRYVFQPLWSLFPDAGDEVGRLGFAAYGVAAFFLWIRFLGFLSVQRELGQFVRVMQNMAKDLGFFGLVWAAMVLAFGSALAGALRIGKLGTQPTQPTCPADQSAKPMRQWFMWWLVRTYLQSQGESYEDDMDTDLACLIFLIMWPLFNIVLVNLLVAVMGDRYKAAKKESEISYCLDLYSLDQEIRQSARANPLALIWATVTYCSSGKRQPPRQSGTQAISQEILKKLTWIFTHPDGLKHARAIQELATAGRRNLFDEKFGVDGAEEVAGELALDELSSKVLELEQKSSQGKLDGLDADFERVKLLAHGAVESSIRRFLDARRVRDHLAAATMDVVDRFGRRLETSRQRPAAAATQLLQAQLSQAFVATPMSCTPSATKVKHWT